MYKLLYLPLKKNKKIKKKDILFIGIKKFSVSTW
jgi:hypothetical protein